MPVLDVENELITTSTPEIDLVLACSQTKLDKQNEARIRKLLDYDLNWDLVYDLCFRHCVISLLFNNIQQYEQLIPAKAFNKFRAFDYKNNCYNTLVTSKLAKILEVFKSKEIPVLSFKGPSLATSAYGNVGLRTFCDVDILIEPKNVSLAMDILNKLGYSLSKKITQVAKTSYGKSSIFLESLNHQKSLEFVDESQLFIVELHWSLFNKSYPVKVSFEHLWQNKAEFNLSGKSFSQFSMEDLLIYLCIHGRKHYWSRLQWICDVNELIRANPDLDWNEVQNRAAKWNCRTMLYLGLILAQNLFDVTLPESIQQQIDKDRTAQSLAKQICDRLFDSDDSEFNNYLFMLRCRERVSDKLIYLLSIIFIPNERDWHFLKLPESLHFLYFIIRPLRLLVKFLFSFISKAK